jgi:RNA polymerase sigma-70 factor (ECF subfamily)
MFVKFVYFTPEACAAESIRESGTMSDGELVRQTLAGQTQAYAELVRRWAGRVLAVCHARLGRADAADDMAQEALLRAFRGLSSLAEADKFGAWICGIASRACLDWLKAKERTQVPFSVLGRENDPTNYLCTRPDLDGAAQDRVEDLRQLMVEVEALPDDYREIVMLYYYDDVTYRDLAQQLGVSPATVNARLTRARALLRERLTRKLGR